MKFNKWIVIGILFVIILYSLAECFYNKEGFLIGTTGIEQICKTDISGVCYDISYIDQTTNETKHISATILQGYFIDSSGYLELVPFGYIGSTDMRSYDNNPEETSIRKGISSINYETNSIINNKNKQTDDTYQDNNYTPFTNDVNNGKVWIDISGNVVAVPYSDVKNKTLYNKIGTYKFNSGFYIPNYEESVYLSNNKTNNRGNLK